MTFNFDEILASSIDKLDIQKELKKGPIPIPKNDITKWTSGQVLALVANPIYTGIGPYPKMIDDELWIKAVNKQIEALGTELVLRVLLDSLRQAFDDI